MSTDSKNADYIDEAVIAETLRKNRAHDAARIREILTKARELKGLDMDEMAALTTISDPELISELFEAARYAKDEIYGNRLVVFAPMYVSNLCANECLYCAFRARNKEIKRRALSQAEIADEAKALIESGHKRILLVAGESYPKEGFDYVLESIKTIYATKAGNGEIRRINVNVAPLESEQFVQLKEAGIGTYQLFQETYHRETYSKMHVSGKKSDYDYRILATDRAMEAGIDDIGIGVLFGLYDWRFELCALLQHIRHLEGKYGVGPHTLSVPRLEPATGSGVAAQPPNPVSDFDFRKIVAILRLTVPYTGIIMSTRETANIRRETFALGVSQISAGSRTNPGGYGDEGEDKEQKFSQFSLGDHRSLDEVIKDVASLGYVPSFCTGCYRLGRTGQDFMDLAQPGLIKHYCQPNAISTFKEYLMDYGSEETIEVGNALIKEMVAKMPEKLKKRTAELLKKVGDGNHDVYV
ncbi:[FeFe] hydrogenase H-cluster radical SAM maturase HydG [bacterium M21]|nr:[FeFe] hydrogenase H-cluster radical SAM maturase HydG [bacterium M21]